MCGKGGAPTTSATVQSQNAQYTPYSQPLMADIYNRAQQVASTPYQPYTGELVAGMNGYQYGGLNQVMDSSQLAQPYIQQGAGNVAGAAGMINSAQQDYLPQAANYTNQGAGGVGNIGAGDISQYMNPYQDQVIQASLANMAENNAQQQQQVQGNAAMRGALGGDRLGVAQAELARQQALANNQTLAGLNSQNYQQATQTALTQQQNQQANQNRAMQAGSQFAGLGATQAGIGTQLAGAGMQYGNLGQQAQQAGITGGQSLLGAGSVSQQTQQAQDTANYQQYLQQLAFPYQQTQFMAGIGLPAAGAMGGSQTQVGASNQILTPPGMTLQQGLIGGGALLGGLLGAKSGGRIPRFSEGGAEDSYEAPRSHHNEDARNSYENLSDALDDRIVPQSQPILISNSRPTPMQSMTSNIPNTGNNNSTSSTTGLFSSLGSFLGNLFSQRGGRIGGYDSGGSVPPALAPFDSHDRFPYPPPVRQTFPDAPNWDSLATHAAANKFLGNIAAGVPSGTPATSPTGGGAPGSVPGTANFPGIAPQGGTFTDRSAGVGPGGQFVLPGGGVYPGFIAFGTPGYDRPNDAINMMMGSGGWGDQGAGIGAAGEASGGRIYRADGGGVSSEIGDNPYNLRHVRGAIPSMQGIQTPKVQYGDFMKISPAMDITKAAASNTAPSIKDIEKLGSTAGKLYDRFTDDDHAEEEASGGRIQRFATGGLLADPGQPGMSPGWETLIGPDFDMGGKRELGDAIEFNPNNGLQGAGFGIPGTANFQPGGFGGGGLGGGGLGGGLGGGSFGGGLGVPGAPSGPVGPVGSPGGGIFGGGDKGPSGDAGKGGGPGPASGPVSGGSQHGNGISVDNGSAAPTGNANNSLGFANSGSIFGNGFGLFGAPNAGNIADPSIGNPDTGFNSGNINSALSAQAGYNDIGAAGLFGNAGGLKGGGGDKGGAGNAGVGIGAGPGGAGFGAGFSAGFNAAAAQAQGLFGGGLNGGNANNTAVGYNSAADLGGNGQMGAMGGPSLAGFGLGLGGLAGTSGYNATTGLSGLNGGMSLTDAGGNLGGGLGGGTGTSGPGAVGFGMGANGFGGALAGGLGGNVAGGSGFGGGTVQGGPGFGNNGIGRTGNGFGGLGANPGNFGLGLGLPGLGKGFGGFSDQGGGGFGNGDAGSGFMGFDSGMIGGGAGGMGFSNSDNSGDVSGGGGFGGAPGGSLGGGPGNGPGGGFGGPSGGALGHGGDGLGGGGSQGATGFSAAPGGNNQSGSPDVGAPGDKGSGGKGDGGNSGKGDGNEGGQGTTEGTPGGMVSTGMVSSNASLNTGNSGFSVGFSAGLAAAAAAMGLGGGDASGMGGGNASGLVGGEGVGGVTGMGGTVGMGMGMGADIGMGGSDAAGGGMGLGGDGGLGGGGEGGGMGGGDGGPGGGWSRGGRYRASGGPVYPQFAFQGFEDGGDVYPIGSDGGMVPVDYDSTPRPSADPDYTLLIGPGGNAYPRPVESATREAGLTHLGAKMMETPRGQIVADQPTSTSPDRPASFEQRGVGDRWPNGAGAPLPRPRPAGAPAAVPLEQPSEVSAASTNPYAAARQAVAPPAAGPAMDPSKASWAEVMSPRSPMYAGSGPQRKSVGEILRDPRDRSRALMEFGARVLAANPAHGWGSAIGQGALGSIQSFDKMANEDMTARQKAQSLASQIKRHVDTLGEHTRHNQASEGLQRDRLEQDNWRIIPSTTQSGRYIKINSKSGEALDAITNQPLSPEEKAGLGGRGGANSPQMIRHQLAQLAYPNDPQKAAEVALGIRPPTDLQIDSYLVKNFPQYIGKSPAEIAALRETFKRQILTGGAAATPKPGADAATALPDPGEGNRVGGTWYIGPSGKPQQWGG